MLEKVKEMKMDDVVLALLDKVLPPEFNAVKTIRSIADKEPFATSISNLKAVALDVRRKASQEEKKEETSAMMVQKEVKYSYPVKSHFCRKSNSWKPVWIEGKGSLCFKCESYGHMSARCKQVNMVSSILAVADDNRKNVWAVDSCATISVTPYIADFMDGTYTKGVYGSVMVANGKRELIIGMGLVSLKVKVANEDSCVDMLFTAHHVPGLTKRLFSVNSARDDNIKSTINVTHPCGKQLQLEEVNGFPTFSVHRPYNEVHLVAGPSDEMIEHARRGHFGNVEGELCEACVKGKLTHCRHSHFPKERALKVNELVHTDLLGAITPASRSGLKYAQVFVDSHYRYYSVKLLKHKSDSSNAMNEFLKEEQASGFTVGTIFSDNAKELIGSESK